MELTPPSAHSPASPYPAYSNPQPLYEYPSPAQSDSRFRGNDSIQADSIQGLGLYSCQIPGSNVENVSSLSSNKSPTGTNSWPPALQHRDAPRSSHSTPNVLSTEYDPFTPYQPVTSAPYTHDIYTAQTAEVTILPASPVPSGNNSQRSSFSSAPASEIFAPGLLHSYTPRIKMEDHSEYPTGNESMMLESPHSMHSMLPVSASPYPGSLEATFYHDQQLSWPKVEYPNPPGLPSITSLPIPPYDRRSESQERGSSGSGQRRVQSSTIARTRQPRKLTTKEDANYQCSHKGCGKLFGRSYNFKAHLETHDTSREYPFPCLMKDCNKKFVRKTDLARHNQSVHLKERHHKCDYCSRYFARKDTLRRHMEDGCSKRFDIETVDFRPQSYSNNDQNSMRVPSRGSDQHSRQASYCSSANYSPPPGGSPHGAHDGSLTSAPGTFMERQEYLGGNHGHDAVWSN